MELPPVKILFQMLLIQTLKRHRTFIGNVVAMMSGKSIAAAIALVTMPIVARLFSPADFGVAAAFLSIVGILSNVSSLRYERAIVVPKADEESVALMALSYRILVAACIAMLIFLSAHEMAGWHLSVLELMGTWAWLLPLGVFLSGALCIQDQWLTRESAFRLAAGSLVAGSAITGGVRILFGTLSGSSVYGLISGNLLGLIARILVQRMASLEGLRAALRYFTIPEMRRVAGDYSDFPKLNAPAGLIFALGQNLPVLLFGVMFAPAIAGYYAMANRLSQVPITVVASSMRRVFFQKAAEVKNQGRSLRKAFLITTGGLALVGIVPFAGLWLVGQSALVWLLGEEWAEAGSYLEIMAPWLYMVWVTAPSNPVFVVLRKQSVWLAMQTWVTILRLTAFGVAHLLSAEPTWTLNAFVIVTVAGNLFTIGAALFLIHNSQNGNTDPEARKAMDLAQPTE
jgi:O-antigen/teichoic acid export membrane protein